jgi:cell division protein FtsB|tara:strand:- start:936 stop:1247 length:312 start_codon:yes stop_codon:yes gene_type:complete
MEWIKGKLGQIIALAALVSTIAGFGYAGAGYVTRLEAVEKKSGVSYTAQLRALDNTDNALQQEIIILIGEIKTLRNELTILSKQVNKIEDKQDNSSNPLIQIK